MVFAVGDAGVHAVLRRYRVVVPRRGRVRLVLDVLVGRDVGAALDHRVAQHAAGLPGDGEEVRSPAAAAVSRRPRSSARARAGRSACRRAVAAAGRRHGDDRGDRRERQHAAHDDGVEAPALRLLGAAPARRRGARRDAGPFPLCGSSCGRTLSTARPQSCGDRVLCMTPLGRGSRRHPHGRGGRRRGRGGDGRPRRGHRVEAPRRVLRRAGGARPGGRPRCSRWSSSRTGGSTSAGSGSAPRRTVSTRSRESTAPPPSRRGPPARTCSRWAAGWCATAARSRAFARTPLRTSARRCCASTGWRRRCRSRLPGKHRRRMHGTARRPGRGCAATWRPAAAGT